MANNENRTVIGSYNTQQEAMEQVDRLVSEGYTKSDITLYSNSETASTLGSTKGVDVETTTGAVEHDESMWERIKDAFSVDTRDEDHRYDQGNVQDNVLEPYQSDLNAGHVVVIVNNYKGMGTDMPGSKATGTQLNGQRKGMDKDLDKNRHRDIDKDDTIQLKEERLEVDKHNVKTGEVDVHKRTVTENRTVDIPVEHEEVVIERRDVKDGEAVVDGMNDSKEIHIPISEEQVEITKKPVVTEEVSVRKEKKHDTKHVSEEVEREELDVETEGNVHVEDTNDKSKRSGKRNMKDPVNDPMKRSGKTGKTEPLDGFGNKEMDDKLRPTDETGSDDHMDNV